MAVRICSLHVERKDQCNYIIERTEEKSGGQRVSDLVMSISSNALCVRCNTSLHIESEKRKFELRKVDFAKKTVRIKERGFDPALLLTVIVYDDGSRKLSSVIIFPKLTCQCALHDTDFNLTSACSP